MWTSDVAFAGREHGWIASDSGLLASTNGGATWKLRKATTYPVGAVSFDSASDGWADGTDRSSTPAVAHVLHTTDGGATWIAQASPIADVEALQFVGSLRGWVAGSSGPAYRTTDGGADWQPETLPVTPWVQSLDFLDAEHGWVAGQDGMLAVTTDGGDHRVAQDSGSTTMRIYDVDFTSARVGWAAGEDGAHGLLRTTDGGAHWVAVTRFDGMDAEGVRFGDARHGWLWGDFGGAFETRNGGATGTWRAAGWPNGISAMDFVSGGLGWAVGESGFILVHPDRTKPVTAVRGRSLSVRRGRRVTFRFKVTDLDDTSAAVSIKLRGVARVLHKTIAVGRVRTGRVIGFRWKATLPNGLYRFTVVATDAAGNPQGKAGAGWLRVR